MGLCLCNVKQDHITGHLLFSRYFVKMHTTQKHSLSVLKYFKNTKYNLKVIHGKSGEQNKRLFWICLLVLSDSLIGAREMRKNTWSLVWTPRKYKLQRDESLWQMQKKYVIHSFWNNLHLSVQNVQWKKLSSLQKLSQENIKNRLCRIIIWIRSKKFWMQHYYSRNGTCDVRWVERWSADIRFHYMALHVSLVNISVWQAVFSVRWLCRTLDFKSFP